MIAALVEFGKAARNLFLQIVLEIQLTYAAWRNSRDDNEGV